MTLKHGFQMWQLNIPNPWEISSVVFCWVFFSLYSLLSALCHFSCSPSNCLSVSLCTPHYSRDCCALVLMFSWGSGGTIISSLAVAAEQCKVSLHLILVTKCYWTAVCWVSHFTGYPVCDCVDISICWCIYAQKEHDLLTVILVKTCNFGQ